MRLITFQSKELLDEALKTGVGRSEWTSYNRLKECDEEHLYELNDEDYMPLYCFATIRGEVPSLYCIGRNWSYFKGWMNFDNRVMIELEVPENEVLSMKDEFVFKDGESIIRSGYEKAVNNVEERKENTYEALIPYIKKEWVVAYRDYSNGTKYGCVEVNTHVINDELCPLWTKAVVFSGDGYMRNPELCTEENKEHRVGYVEYPKAIIKDYELDEYSPSGCYNRTGLYDALFIMNREAGKEWSDNHLQKYEWKKLKKFIEDHNYPSVKEAEELLKEKMGNY